MPRMVFTIHHQQCIKRKYLVRSFWHMEVLRDWQPAWDHSVARSVDNFSASYYLFQKEYTLLDYKIEVLCSIYLKAFRKRCYKFAFHFCKLTHIIYPYFAIFLHFSWQYGYGGLKIRVFQSEQNLCGDVGFLWYNFAANVVGIRVWEHFQYS